MFSTFPAYADEAFVPRPNCGAGHIQELVEGGEGDDALYFRFWPSLYPEVQVGWTYPNVAPDFNSGWLDNWWVRFDGISDDRRRAIRDLAHVAFTKGLFIGVRSHTGDCGAATELLVQAPVPQ